MVACPGGISIPFRFASLIGSWPPGAPGVALAPAEAAAAPAAAAAPTTPAPGAAMLLAFPGCDVFCQPLSVAKTRTGGLSSKFATES